ncbi:hypothetical protein [Streptomyces sp. S1D4-20]|uniref:hypothetical protein n=1 Tax=Streptomyces sp. S1D4-20 TaxID=2594462 RepID=UPI0013DE9DE4|nr:hypothetical protein [Streptomyces sp. S1D4-20]
MSVAAVPWGVTQRGPHAEHVGQGGEFEGTNYVEGTDGVRLYDDAFGQMSLQSCRVR